jgi:SP family myo-inositol transporter-like MFS transporter 13
MIMLADSLFTVGALIMGLASSIHMLILGRLIVGLGVGIASMVVPIYIAEISPK